MRDEEDREKWNRWEFDLGQGQVVVEVPADLRFSEACEVDEFFRLIVRSLLRRALDAKDAESVRLAITNSTGESVEVRLSEVEKSEEEEEKPHVF